MFSDVLLTVDYDRTLTAPDSTIPQRNLEAIRYFIANGGAFTVNTGRSLPMAQTMLKEVPVSAPLLLYNGSAAYDPQTGLQQIHEIQLELYETMGQILQMFPHLVVEVQGTDAHYNFKEDPSWDAFCAHNHCAYATAKWGQDLGPFLKFSVYGQLHDSTVSGLFEGTAQELAELDDAQRQMQEKFGEWIELYRAAPRIIDVHAKGVSKARAARELQQRLGRKILVCVGDAENDVMMLDDADYSFVPGDAILKERYPNVCNCADGAVADVIYKKIPEIVKKSLDKTENSC